MEMCYVRIHFRTIKTTTITWAAHTVMVGYRYAITICHLVKEGSYTCLYAVRLGQMIK